MKRYLIMATITGGTYKGRTYVLKKGGCLAFGVGIYSALLADEYYSTKAAAKMVATKYNKINELLRQTATQNVEPTKYEVMEVI